MNKDTIQDFGFTCFKVYRETCCGSPALTIEETTFCIWRKTTDLFWQIGDIEYPEDENPDGMKDLLFMLDGNPSTYKEFAEDYYEKNIPLASIESIYQHKPLTKELIKTLNEDLSIEDLQEDIKEIGYLECEFEMDKL